MNRFFILALCLLTFASIARAEDPAESQLYDPTYTGQKNEAAIAIREMQQRTQAEQGFIKPETVNVALVHPSYMNDDQFGLELSVPDMISGCYKLSPLEYDAKFVDPYYLDIAVKRYRRIAPEGINAAQKCSQQNQMSTALMTLDKQDLKARGTQEIRFSTELGRDTYKIVLDDARIELIPKSMIVFKGKNLTGPLKDRISYSFATDKMIVLQIPMAMTDENLTGQILEFARPYGLIPVTPDKPASWDGNGRATYYFYDNDARLSSQIGEDGYAQVGTIKVNRPYDGPEGRTETAVDLTVFATKPGMQL